MSIKEKNAIIRSIQSAENPTEALQLCRDGLEEFPDNYQFHCLAGKYCKTLDDVPAALDFLEKATLLQPTQEPAWQGLEDLYAARHKEYSGTSREQVTDDKWMEVLEKWIACAAKKRKVKVKMGKALMQCGAPERRREAFKLWSSLVPTSKNDKLLKVPLLTVAAMILNSPIVDNEEIDLELLTYGTAELRLDLLTQLLEYRLREPLEVNVPMEKILGRCVAEILANTTDDTLHEALHTCENVVAQYGSDRVGNDDDDEDKDDDDDGTAPLLREITLLKNIVPLATFLECCGAQSSEVATSSLSTATSLVSRHPLRPLGHLYLSLIGGRDEDTTEKRLKHAKIALTLWQEEVQRETKAEQQRDAAAKSSVSLSSTAKKRQLEAKKKVLLECELFVPSKFLRETWMTACRLKCVDLMLANSQSSVLRGEIVEGDHPLDPIIRLSSDGLNGSSSSVSTSSASSSMLSALHMCVGIARMRRNDPISTVSTCFEQSVSNAQSQRMATLGLVECAAMHPVPSSLAAKQGYKQGREQLKGIDTKDFLVLGLGGMLDSRESQGMNGKDERAKQTKRRKRSMLLLQKALEMLEEESSNRNDDSTWLQHWEAIFRLELGRIMWYLGDEEPDYRTNKAHCYTQWIRSAKLRSSWGAPLCCLGKYFVFTSSSKKSIQRGLLLIERGLHTNPMMAEEGTLYAYTLLSTPSAATNSDIYQRAIETYKSAIEGSLGRATWASQGAGALHMGLLSRMQVGNPARALHITHAIEAYQMYVREVTKSPRGWMRLGQAYKAGARWTPALKSFEECLLVCEREAATEEAATCRVAALRCLSEVNMAITEYETAIEKAREGLKVLSVGKEETQNDSGDIMSHEKYLLLSVLSTSLLQLARRSVSSDLFGHAHALASEGLSVVESLLHKKGRDNNEISLHKLNGDLHSLLGLLPHKVHRDDVEKKNTENDVVSLLSVQQEYLQQAMVAYERVLVIQNATITATTSAPSLTAVVAKGRALLDVGVASFRHVRHTRRHIKTMKDDDSLLQKAHQSICAILTLTLQETKTEDTANKNEVDAAAVAATTISSSSSSSTLFQELLTNAWNVMGVLSAYDCSGDNGISSSSSTTTSSTSVSSSPIVAQYCFSKAIRLSSGNHAQAWSNLGFLYLKCGHTSKAMSAFMTSQSLSPASSVMWCGLGMATDVMTPDQGSTNSTVDNDMGERGYSAYQCAMEYFPHLQAKMGLGLTALSMGRYDVALLSLQRAHDEDSSNADIVNALGVVAEHLQLHDVAVEAFGETMRLLQESSVIDTATRDNMLRVAARNLKRAEIKVSSPLSKTTSQIQISMVPLENWTNLTVPMSESPTLIVSELLELTESRWWNIRQRRDVGALLASSDANIFANMWKDMSSRLNEAQHVSHALSCARFAVCVSSHGTSSTASACLLHLGAMLKSSGQETVLMNVVETKGEENDGKLSAHRSSMIFAELDNDRPRWVELPLAYRTSCSCAKTAKETATRAIQINPSSEMAWRKLKEWS